MTGTTLVIIAGIGLSGACGAVVRYLIGRFVAERLLSSFPLGTLLINSTGSFLIGLVFALAASHLITPEAQLILATGFLGGYTTFSTMQWEALQLIRSGSKLLSLFYLGGTVVLGAGGVLLGMVVGRWL